MVSDSPGDDSTSGNGHGMKDSLGTVANVKSLDVSPSTELCATSAPKYTLEPYNLPKLDIHSLKRKRKQKIQPTLTEEIFSPQTWTRVFLIKTDHDNDFTSDKALQQMVGKVDISQHPTYHSMFVVKNEHHSTAWKLKLLIIQPPSNAEGTVMIPEEIYCRDSPFNQYVPLIKEYQKVSGIPVTDVVMYCINEGKSIPLLITYCQN